MHECVGSASVFSAPTRRSRSILCTFSALLLLLLATCTLPAEDYTQYRFVIEAAKRARENAKATSAALLQAVTPALIEPSAPPPSLTTATPSFTLLDGGSVDSLPAPSSAGAGYMLVSATGPPGNEQLHPFPTNLTIGTVGNDSSDDDDENLFDGVNRIMSTTGLLGESNF